MKRVVLAEGGRQEEKTIPMFSGCILVRVKQSEHAQVLETPGILRCMTYGGLPVQLSNEAVERLMRLQEAEGWISDSTPILEGTIGFHVE